MPFEGSRFVGGQIDAEGVSGRVSPVGDDVPTCYGSPTQWFGGTSNFLKGVSSTSLCLSGFLIFSR